MGFERCHVLGQVAPRQQAAVHLGVQGFNAAIQHLGETGELSHLGHGQTVVGQQFGGAARGDEFDTQRMQGLGKLKNAGFVGDGDKCVHGVVRKSKQ